MAFTKQHYEAIAKIIKSYTQADPEPPSDDTEVRLDAVSVRTSRWIAKDLIDYFAKDNPRFDCDKFIKACGL